MVFWMEQCVDQHPSRKRTSPSGVSNEEAVYRGMKRDARQERKGDTIPKVEGTKKGRNRVTGKPGASRATEKCPLKFWGYSYC